jgi:hypothetical protein
LLHEKEMFELDLERAKAMEDKKGAVMEKLRKAETELQSVLTKLEAKNKKQTDLKMKAINE